MKLSIATEDDPFIRRKCDACKRIIRPGQPVLSRFDQRREYGRAWFVLHLSCVQCSEPMEALLAGGLVTPPIPGADVEAVATYYTLREQILATKEAFPDAAA